MGDEEGMADVAAEYGVRHFPDVACSEKGIPLIGAMFELAREVSDSPILAIVNTDILLMSDFLAAGRHVMGLTDAFVLMGQRWDLDVTAPLDFSESWQERLKQDAISRGRLHHPAGSDYFIFPRIVFNKVPNFTIGRAGWDNWMIYQAVKQPWLAINATSSIMIVHQNHDYNHLADGKAHYKLEETFENVDLAGGYKHMYTLIEVDNVLVDGIIRSAGFSFLRLIRWLEILFVPDDHSPSGLRWIITRFFRRLHRKLRK